MPSFSDGAEGYTPPEYDFTDFYTTDNIGTNNYIYHRMDVNGPTTTTLPPSIEMGWYFDIYYDTDNNGSTGAPGLGAEYSLNVDLWIDQSGTHSYYLHRMWNETLGTWMPSGWTGHLDWAMDDSTIELGLSDADQFLPANGTIGVTVVASPPMNKSLGLGQMPSELEDRVEVLKALGFPAKHHSCWTYDPLPSWDFYSIRLPLQIGEFPARMSYTIVVLLLLAALAIKRCS